MIVKLIQDNPNLRFLASIDPSNTNKEIETIKKYGFSTMFFGDDTIDSFKGLNMVKCQKTWHHIMGACQTCDKCFGKKRVNIHIKKH